jgi:CRISPR system Cascade subunit CasA
MNQHLAAAIAAGMLIPIISGCQTIAPEPFHLSDIKIHLEDTPLDIEPIHQFAKSLLADNSNDGESYDPTDGITLREAQAITMWYNPEVRAARSGIQYAEAIANDSGKWADPLVAPSIGRKKVDTDSGSDRNWIIESGLKITLPISGRLGAERNLRGAQQDVAVLAAQEAEWNASRELQEAWMQWSASTESFKLLDEHIGSLAKLVDTTEALAKAGELSTVNVRFLRIEYLQRLAEREARIHETMVARMEVHSVMGLVSDADVDLAHSMKPTFPSGIDENVTISESHPSVSTLRGLYEESEKALRLELRKQYPDITFSPTYADEEDETSLVFGFGLPVPAWNRNKQGITAAVSARKRAKAEVEHTYQHLMIVLAQDISRRMGAEAQRMQLVNDVSPLLDQQLAETENLLSVGELDVLLLHNVLKQTLEIKQSILESSLREQLARIKIVAATEPQLLIPEPLKEINP